MLFYALLYTIYISLIYNAGTFQYLKMVLELCINININLKDVNFKNTACV